MPRREPLLPLHGPRRRHHRICTWSSVALVAVVLLALGLLLRQQTTLPSGSLEQSRAPRPSPASSVPGSHLGVSQPAPKSSWRRSEPVEAGCELDESPEAAGAVQAAAAVASPHAGVARGKRYAIISTWPPTKCGLATFSAGLRDGLLALGAKQVDVLAVHLRTGRSTAYGPEVVMRIYQDVPEDYALAARYILQQRYTAVFLQHEYGIFGGFRGEHIVALAQSIRSVPLVTVLHTVETAPQPAVQHALHALLTASVAVVTLSPAGCRGVAGWATSVGLPAQFGDMCHHVPHGVPRLPLCARGPLKQALGVDPRAFLILTGGLLSAPKGVEHVIAAMPHVASRIPSAVLLIAGEAHPVHGAGYLERLHRAVEELGVQSLVQFKTAYVPQDELHAEYQAADVFVAPHSASEQTSSGTMLMAMAAGAPVVATPFSQAAELLSGGAAGVLVPFGNSSAIADALVALASDPRAAARLRAGAYVTMAPRTWPAVAASFVQVASLPGVAEFSPAPRYEAGGGGGGAAGLAFESPTSAEVGDGTLAVAVIRNVGWTDGVGPGWYPLDSFLAKRRGSHSSPSAWGLDTILLNGNFLGYEQGAHRASSRVLEDLNTTFGLVGGGAGGSTGRVLETRWYGSLGSSRTGITGNVVRRMSVAGAGDGGSGEGRSGVMLDLEASIAGDVEPAASVWLTVGMDQLSSNPDVEWDSVTTHDTGGQHTVHASCSWSGTTLTRPKVRAFAIHGRRLGDGSSTAVQVALRTAPAEVNFVCNGDLRLQYVHYDVALHEVDEQPGRQGPAMAVRTKADIRWTG